MSETDATLIIPTVKTTLVVEPGEAQVLTPVRKTDARTAMARGLKEYLEQLAIDWPGGRQSKFKKVFQTWAEPEVLAEYPSAVVYATDPMTYGGDGESDAAPMVPGLRPDRKLPDGSFLLMPTECVQQFQIECWSTDPQEQMAITAMVEDAMNPVDWMYGVRLTLPHYHGVRMDAELLSMAYAEAEGEASHRYRKVAAFVVRARVPLCRVVGPRPKLQVRTVIEIDPPELEPPTPAELAAAAGEWRVGARG